MDDSSWQFKSSGGGATEGHSPFAMDVQRGKRRRARMSELPEETIINGHAIKRLCIEGEPEPMQPHPLRQQQANGGACPNSVLPPSLPLCRFSSDDDHPFPSFPSQDSMDAFGNVSPFSSQNSSMLSLSSAATSSIASSVASSPLRTPRFTGPGPVPRSMSDSCLMEPQYQHRMAQGYSPNAHSAHGQSPMEGDVDYSLINSMLKLLHFEKVHRVEPFMPPAAGP